MSFDADELRRDAAQLANQLEFGPDPFAENLERLLAALDQGGDLTPSGLEITRAELTGYLCNRLSVQRWLREVPEIEARAVERPIFFMGLPRSGTTFLLNLSRRFVRRGYSASEFHLRMTREELGSYLGLELETVSRLFSQFQKDGLNEVNQKHVCILDIAGLERVLAGK